MRTDPKFLNERLDRLANVLDEIMPNCALLVRDALGLLKEQPDIVRCKDCKHRSENHRCYADNPMRGQFVGSDWFCADGERRTDDA